VNKQPLTAILAGGTGLVGGECLDCLLERPEYGRVIVLARRELGAAARHPKVQQLITDFSDLDSVGPALTGEHVFCALGTTIRKAGSQQRFREVDYEYPRRIAELARERGARHFSIVSALGANPGSPFFYSRVKGELEQALKVMDWPSLGVFRPSLIAGQRAESRPMEKLGERLLRFAPAGWSSVEARQIARAMVAVALKEPRGVTIVESREIPRRAKSLS
jgi:uncharacterized protein YbjT (DUF2867 family)